MKALILLLALAGEVSAFKEAVLFLAGASCLEELDSQTVERYEALSVNPLNLNSAPRSKLLSSGLFSPFQVASLIDFRSRTGDILSFTELSMIDGFSSEYSEALKCFVILESSSPPGKRRNTSFAHEIELKAKYNSADFSFAGKYCFSASDVFQACITSTGTFSLAWFSRSLPLKLMIGDFNARFGQGLSMWNGMSMSGFPTVSSFRKNGCGFSPVTGYSSENHRGVSFDLGLGRWTISAGFSFPGLGNIMRGKVSDISYLPIVSASYMGKIFSFSMLAHSHFSKSFRSHTLSADFRIGFPSLSFFGEAAFNVTSDTKTLFPALSAGAIWSPAYDMKFSILARYFSPSYKNDFSSPASSSSRTSDEAGISAGASLSWMNFTSDFSWRPSDKSFLVKPVCTLSRQFSIMNGLSLTPSLRFLMRYKPSEADRVKTDIRADVCLDFSDWSFCARYNTIFYLSRSWLWYVETGWKKTFLRFTLFKVDNWSDRIYAYERTSPGSFSVPSFYGRGYEISVYSSLKIRKMHTLYLVASYISYPWSLISKDNKLTAQLQYSLSLHSNKKSHNFVR